jgi:8-oxo-dGTP diphosphatase
VTVDIVLLRRTKAGPEVLLIKRAHEPFRGRWALPGGFVDANESLETAAARELEEETGLRGIALEQIKAFGDPGRDPRGHTISIVFAGKVDSGLVPRAADDAADAGWHSALRPPPLAFDHDQILHFVLGRKRTRTR